MTVSSVFYKLILWLQAAMIFYDFTVKFQEILQINFSVLFIWKPCMWPVKMTAEPKFCPDKSSFWPDIVRWPAVILSPVMVTWRLCNDIPLSQLENELKNTHCVNVIKLSWLIPTCCHFKPEYTLVTFIAIILCNMSPASRVLVGPMRISN